MKKDKEKQPRNEEQKQSGEVSRRDFLVGAGSVIVGGAIGAGIAYPLASGGEGGDTKTVEVPKTVERTVTTTLGDGATATVTQTTTLDGNGQTVISTVTQTVTGTTEDTTKTIVRTHSLGSFAGGGEFIATDVDKGRIVRIRPLHFDQNYTLESYSRLCGVMRPGVRNSDRS